MRAPWTAALTILAAALVACDDGIETDESDVIVKTETEAQWQQYLANVDFVEDYEPACFADPSQSPQERGRPRVLVTGFGRFLENKENATGRMVAALAPGLLYPETEPPAAGSVDEPAAQTRVHLSTVTLEGFGEVELCRMILPVFWDVAALLVLEEAAAFEPDLVLMNGIAGDRQPLWLELGSVNEAVALPDGSGTLAPVEAGSKLLLEAGDAERARGLLMSWADVKSAALAARTATAAELNEDGVPFGDVLQGALFAGFPRSSNTYLCNNTTYALNYILDHPYETFRLLTPSHPREGGPEGVDFTLYSELQLTARAFVHWPKGLSGSHIDRGAEVMRALIAAQLGSRTAPSRGDNTLADFTE